MSLVADKLYMQSLLLSLSCSRHLFLTSSRTPCLHAVWKGSLIAEASQAFELVLTAAWSMPKKLPKTFSGRWCYGSDQDLTCETKLSDCPDLLSSACTAEWSWNRQTAFVQDGTLQKCLLGTGTANGRSVQGQARASPK